MVEVYLKNVRCYSFHGCLKEDQRIQKITVSVSKLCPPINGDVESVAIKLSQKRGKKI